MKNKPEFLHFPDTHSYLSLLCYSLSYTFQKSVFTGKGMGVGGMRNVFLCQGFSHPSASLRHKAQQAHQFKPVSNEDNLHLMNCTERTVYLPSSLRSHIRPPGHPRLRQQYASFPHESPSRGQNASESVV